MKRIDIIFNELSKIKTEKGISAHELAERLNYDRTNVSSDLNKLWKEGKVQKSKGRPVFFSCKENDCNHHSTSLDQLLKDSPSLAAAIEQGKAAILYPPFGMHCLILGETGVGKSTFAGFLHQYAIETKKMKDDAPFITFNCADYAHNPQLLLGQLFGIRKSAFTGATAQQGLIEKANEGILFLDEIHRLPFEGQEMLFTFIDKGVFRRLGETETERRAKVLLLAATTEDPDLTLLKTFNRRIPMVIRLPSLRERDRQERKNLIFTFFREEALRLGKEISVSPNSILSFLYYHCPNNIGQLKSDIQLACAKAYADFVTNKKDRININSSDLPGYLREGLLTGNRHNHIVELGYEYYIFNSDGGNLTFQYNEEKYHQNIYENIEQKFTELKEKGLNNEELELLMNIDIDKYFSQYIYGVNQRINIEDLTKVIDPKVIDLAENLVRYAEEQLQKSLNQQVMLGLSLHVQTAIDRIKNGSKIINPQLNKIRKTYNKEFNIALTCIKMIEESIDIDLPIDEAAFLTMFFVFESQVIGQEDGQVEVVVIMHGIGTAPAMVEVTNQLLSSNHAKAMDMPLHIDPKEVYQKLKIFVENRVTRKGLLLLVDMGSLVRFGEMLEKEMGVPVRVVSMVSTPHVIEGTRKAIVGYSLDEIYQDLLNLNSFYTKEEEIERVENKKMAIVTACLTGKGTAAVLKKILTSYLKFDEKKVRIIPINLTDQTAIHAKLDEMRKHHKIISIVSNFPMKVDVKQFDLEEVLSLRAVRIIQDIIDTEEAYLKMAETLAHHLHHINDQGLIPLIRGCVEELHSSLNTQFNSHDLIGVVLHISCMVDRLAGRDFSVTCKDKERIINEHYALYKSIKQSLHRIEHRYRIQITDDEICNMVHFFDFKGQIPIN
ncbi:sigma-54-dependent transcriptional regulator [Peribacillus kribbensis]|uniref:sigma-54-dependent transcriptional regulator n=1 Tax=Peribacillus kribbensis TaxID=356658 RepID=UPI00041C63CB|nr:sigma-54-dependent transcriptional regulator [Peribacillus kribbensis]